MSKECVTHHHACDCREEKFKELERENAALREALNNAIVLLRRWNKNDVTDDVVIDTRKTIHAARKEAQP